LKTGRGGGARRCRQFLLLILDRVLAALFRRRNQRADSPDKQENRSADQFDQAVVGAGENGNVPDHGAP
jgi:hypothetical protein